jgi:hypothetical protein
MNARKRRDVPAGLGGVQRRFERWRRTRRGHARIPNSLWSAAVKAAGRHGLHRTVRALRLDYYSLKERVERQAGTARAPGARVAAGRRRLSARKPFHRRRRLSARGAAGPRRSSVRRQSGRRRADTAQSLPAFLELAPSAVHEFAAASAGPCQCTVEWEDATGAKMRVELKGTAMPDLAALSRSFWNPGS